MAPHLEALYKKIKLTSLISDRTKLALDGFAVAIQSEDPKKQEELRTEIHQLIDDQLDLQLEMKRLKDQHEEGIMDRFRNPGDRKK
jgi:hypothetical protein